MIQQSKAINKNIYRKNIINIIQKLIDINDSIIRETITIINQDYLSYISNSPLTSEEKLKELLLLKRKREPEYFKPKINHDIIFQKEKTFSIINNSKIENIRQKSISKNIINEMQPDPINYETNYFKKLLSEFSRNSKQEEFNKTKRILDNKEVNLFNNSSTIRNPSTKLKYFNIEKNKNTKSILDFGTNNEIKVLKNKKMVYINTDLLNSYSTSRC